MSETKKAMKVGIFVAVGLGALIASLFLLGGTNFLKKTETLYVEFNQAQGLAVGSVVSLAGLNIGNVRELTMASDRNIILAELELDANFFERITDHSKINVKTQGALGDKYIYIDPGAPGGTPVASGATLFSDLQPDFLDVLSSKTNEVGGSAVDVINELSTLLKQLNNKNRSASLMENLLGTSQNLNRLTNEPELKEAMVHLRNILRKVDKGEGTLGALVNDATLHERLVGFLGESPRNRYLVPLIRESIKSADR
jgi:phospholipid/cholesterol/gamma-HCH transport system substrate-binding protein